MKYNKNIHFFIFLIIYLSLVQIRNAGTYNPFSKYRTAKNLDDLDDNNKITTLIYPSSNNENIEFSTKSTIKEEDNLEKFNSFSSEKIFFETQSLNQSKDNKTIHLSSPSTTSSSYLASLPFKENSQNFKLNQSLFKNEVEKRQSNSNPSVDEILSGLIQLIGGNLKLNRPIYNNNQQMQHLNTNNVPNILPQSIHNLQPNLLTPNGLKPLLNPNLLAQFANRNPNLNLNRPQNQNLPLGFFVGPNRLGLPLHFPHKQKNRPLNTSNLINNNINFNNNNLLNQLNPNLNQILSMKSINNLPLNNFNLSNFQLNHLLNNVMNNQSIPLNKILPNHILNLNTSNTSTRGYIKVDESDVSRLLGLTKPTTAYSTRNDVKFSSTLFMNLSSIESVHFPKKNNLTTLNDLTNIALNTIQSSTKILSSPSEQNNLSETINTTVLSNNHNKFGNINRPLITSSFSSSASSSQLSNNNFVLNTQNDFNIKNLNASSSWQLFEMFNTNQNLINPTKTYNTNVLDIVTKPDESPNIFDITVKHKLGETKNIINVIASSPSQTNKNSLNESIKPTSTLSIPQKTASHQINPDVVYGRPENKHYSSINNFEQINQNKIKSLVNIQPSTTTNAIITSVSISNRPTPNLPNLNSKSNEITGRPLVFPVEIDHFKPQINNINQKEVQDMPILITETGGGSVYIDTQHKHFKLKPITKTNTLPSMQIGSAMNVYSSSNLDNRKNNSSLFSTSTTKPILRGSNARRTNFRPKPAVPLVRIDTCIVGDDSTCGSNLNEHCKTEQGISSCQCKPGFGRHTQRSPCIPTTNLALSLKLDKLGDNKLQFSKNLLNPDSEDFQYLEFESIQAINSLFQNSRLNKLFLGIRVNKFYPAQGKTMLNCTIILERNNVTRTSTIKKQMQQELSRVINAKNNVLGDSILWVDATALPRVEDLNECADTNLNDCSRNAKCLNELGTFSCFCKPGFEDRYAMTANNNNNNNGINLPSSLLSFPMTSHTLNNHNNKNLMMKIGRICLGCSASYCSNRGECSIINGEKTCKCKGNYMGNRCDLDAEVLAMAFGGSLAALIIIIITFLCLYIWNQKWKNEQQKIEAMSSGSGQTFSYINKQNNNNFRFGMEERMRGWNPAFESSTLQNNASSYNYYVNPEQILVNTTQQHVYATPSRVQTPDQLLNDDPQANQTHFYNTRRNNKSRNCTLTQGYQMMNYQPGSIYNETEFSTRETLYTPSHLIMNPRQKYSMY